MTEQRGRVVCDLTISADGYSAGLNQTVERPFGDDGGDGWGDRLHAWLADTADENRAEIDKSTNCGCTSRRSRSAAAHDCSRACRPSNSSR